MSIAKSAQKEPHELKIWTNSQWSVLFNLFSSVLDSESIWARRREGACREDSRWAGIAPDKMIFVFFCGHLLAALEMRCAMSLRERERERGFTWDAFCTKNPPSSTTKERQSLWQNRNSIFEPVVWAVNEKLKMKTEIHIVPADHNYDQPIRALE